MSLRLNNARSSTGDSRLRRVTEQTRRTGQARRAASSGIQNARRWGAPRLDRIGHYVENDFGPRVGSMCHRTAGRMQPRQERSGRGLAMPLLLLGGLLGAIGAIATRRGRSRPSGEARRPAPAERLSPVTEYPPGHANTTS